MIVLNLKIARCKDKYAFGVFLTFSSQAAHSRQPCVNSHQLSQWEALGNSHFSPPTKSTYLNRSLKNFSQVIRSRTSTAVQNLVEIRPWGASGQIGEILTIFRFLFIPLFLSNAPTGQTAHHIFTLNGSNDMDSRKDVPFLAFVDTAPHFGCQIAPKPQFLRRE